MHTLVARRTVLVEEQLLSTSVERCHMKGDFDTVAESASKPLVGLLLVLQESNEDDSPTSVADRFVLICFGSPNRRNCLDCSAQ